MASVNAEDVRKIKEMLPRLEQAENERKIKKTNEIERKKREKKDGPSESMTVILLKEVLRELNVTFKASSSKKELILKVKEARQEIKDRSECCQANTYSFFSSSMCIAGCDRTGLFMLIDLETEKRKRVWLFWACLYYLIAVLYVLTS